MIVMTIIACLRLNLAECRTEDLELPKGYSMMTCLTGGQQFAASWQERNPNWVVLGMRCGEGRPV